MWPRWWDRCATPAWWCEDERAGGGADGRQPMSQPLALPPTQRPRGLNRLAALLAVGAGRLLAALPARRLRQALCLARRGARPATAAQALTARQLVVASSVRCAGQGCLQRSIAVALLCRTRGTWPTWCTGVRTEPFRAHAWVEVDGEPIDEPHDAGYYVPTIVVPPVDRPAADDAVVAPISRAARRAGRGAPTTAILLASALLVPVAGPATPGLLRATTAPNCVFTRPGSAAAGRRTPPPWPAPADPSAAARRAGLCMLTAEGVAEHIHAHLDIVVAGRAVPVPAEIGIDRVAHAISPLHTHVPDGIIHIESPVVHDFTLGQFFVEWRVALGRGLLGGLREGGRGHVVACVNGRRWLGDPAAITLRAHDEIALGYGPRPDCVGLPDHFRFPAGA